MTRIGKCKCGGELMLSVVITTYYPTAFCKKCFKEYPVRMVGKSRTYQLIKNEIKKHKTSSRRIIKR